MSAVPSIVLACLCLMASNPQGAADAPASSARTTSEAAPRADLRFHPEPGDVLRYRYAFKKQVLSSTDQSVLEEIDMKATIEGKVQKTEASDGGTTVQFKYESISIKGFAPEPRLKMPEGTTSADSSTEPRNAKEKALRQVIDQLMSKTITMTFDASGNRVGVTGIPLEVFAGMHEYMEKNKETRIAAGREIGELWTALMTLGTASMMKWDAAVCGAGVDPPANAAVGAYWGRYSDGRSPSYLVLAEIDGDRAIVKPKDEVSVGERNDPLHTPARFVWDTKRGRLIDYRGSHNSGAGETLSVEVTLLEKETGP